MRKTVPYLLATMVAVIFSMTPAGLAADYSFSTEEYPGYGVLSYTFPSNERYEWSANFAGRSDAANDWMVRNISAVAAGSTSGFIAIPGGGFGVTVKQAHTAIIGSNRGTAMDAWAEVALQYANRDYPAYVTQTDMLSRNTLWEKIRYTLDGVSFAPDPALDTDTTLGGLSFLRGTPYLYNLNTITGLGFASAVDSAVMNVSGFTNQIMRKRLADVRSARNRAGCDAPLNGFWASPFVTVHDGDEREGYAPFRYKATGGALGYDRECGPLTLGGALFFSSGRYTDRWAPRQNENKSDHYGLSVYGNWYATEKLFVDAHAGYQHSRNNMRRELIGTNGVSSSPPAYHRSARTGAAGDWLGTKNRTGTWWIAARAGYDFGPWRNFTVTPSLGLEYRYADNGGFTASDSAGLPFMEVESMKRRRFLIPADVTVQYRLDMSDALSATLSAGGGYIHDFSNKGTSGTMRYAGMSRSVAIRGGKPREGDWNVHLGATLALRERWEFGGEWRYGGSGNYGYSGSLVFTF